MRGGPSGSGHHPCGRKLRNPATPGTHEGCFGCFLSPPAAVACFGPRCHPSIHPSEHPSIHPNTHTHTHTHTHSLQRGLQSWPEPDGPPLTAHGPPRLGCRCSMTRQEAEAACVQRTARHGSTRLDTALGTGRAERRPISIYLHVPRECPPCPQRVSTPFPKRARHTSLPDYARYDVPAQG